MSNIAFTLDTLDWRAWLEIVPLETATSEQIAVLEESHPTAKQSDYYRLLIHDVPALRERSRLYQAIMYGSGGLPRADRELAATAESRFNGCPYCASVHSRFFAQLRKDEPTIRRLLDEGTDTPLGPRDRAVVDYAVALASTPPSPHAGHLRALRAEGLSEAEILDLTNAVAMFAWANRLMQSLGEAIRPPAPEAAIGA